MEQKPGRASFRRDAAASSQEKSPLHRHSRSAVRYSPPRICRTTSLYCASKGALDQLTRVMAIELGPHGIRTNSVNSTVVLTPMGQRAWGDPAKSGPMLARTPLGRFAQPLDVAQAVTYLLSDGAAMINGATLFVDGGFLAS
ncbi:SDR family oxidoreductase [Deinococcus sp. UYEF24]